MTTSAPQISGSLVAQSDYNLAFAAKQLGEIDKGIVRFKFRCGPMIIFRLLMSLNSAALFTLTTCPRLPAITNSSQ